MRAWLAAVSLVAVALSPAQAGNLYACAPNVAPETLASIIHVESKGDPLVINVNGIGRVLRPRNATQAVALAREHIAAGRSVDMGLMQVNSSNLKRLGYALADMFEPCRNIEAGGRVLSAFYARASKQHADPQQALLAALSAYNTGSFTRGFRNGYVGRYFGGQAPAPRVPEQSPARKTRALQDPLQTLIFTRMEARMKDSMSNKDPKITRHRQMPVISQNPADELTPGVMVEYSREEAARLGAFEEDAMSEADAWEANFDLEAEDTAIVAGGSFIGPDSHDH